jgi:hypothetical protein
MHLHFQLPNICNHFKKNWISVPAYYSALEITELLNPIPITPHYVHIKTNKGHNALTGIQTAGGKAVLNLPVGSMAMQ